MKAKSAALVLGAIAATLVFAALGPRRSAMETYEHLSPTFSIHEVIPSMVGPVSNDNQIFLTSEKSPELLWIRGYEAHMVAPDGKNTASQEFMCHNTLSIHRGLEQHRKIFQEANYGTRRLFTLSYGQYDIEFPKGFGIPIAATEKLMLQSKVLNLNETGIGSQVRHKVDVHFVRDQDLTQPMKPLCLIAAAITVPHGDPQAIVSKPSAYDPDYGPHGNEKAAPKEPVCEDDSGDDISGFVDSESWGGLKVFGHHGEVMWKVPQGRDVRHTTLSQLFPFDTTVHYISVHAHPALETFELRDATANVSLFTAVGEQVPTGVGLKRVSHFSSEAGIPVYKDHKYELISVYNNHTGKDVAAMAFVWCYIQDQNFRKPDARSLVESDETLCGPPLFKQ